MLLRNQGQFNDLSPKLRDELVKRVKGFGKTVRYKFDISNINPDPEKVNGKVIWPNVYTLQPATFYINDKYENREGKSSSKLIGLIDRVDEKGTPVKFRKIKVLGKFFGILKLELEEIPDHFDYAMYIEMHPKLSGGMFADKTKRQIVSRIDEFALAKEASKNRSEKLKALSVAQGLSDKEVVDFADAMMWDSTQDIEILRNQVEELAENNPVYFNDLVKGKTIEYRALVKKATDLGIILFDPAEYKYVYSGTNQPIVVLSPVGDKSEVEKMAEWLLTGGNKADEVFKKIKSLIK